MLDLAAILGHGASSVITDLKIMDYHEEPKPKLLKAFGKAKTKARSTPQDLKSLLRRYKTLRKGKKRLWIETQDKLKHKNNFCFAYIFTICMKGRRSRI